VLGVAIAFGGASLAIVLAGITIPIPGTPVVTDPREIFTTTGAALTGPIGGVVIGVMAGIAEPEIPLASLLAHITGGIFVGFAYKNLSWRHRADPLRSHGLWVFQILIYYAIIVVPLFVVGLFLFYPSSEYGSFSDLLAALERGAIWEMLITALVTTIGLSALPSRYRQPLW
jgi:hypothetical protein